MNLNRAWCSVYHFLTIWLGLRNKNCPMCLKIEPLHQGHKGSVEENSICQLCRKQAESGRQQYHMLETHLPALAVDCDTSYNQSEAKGQIINIGLCPFCLGHEGISIGQRFQFCTTRHYHIHHTSGLILVTLITDLLDTLTENVPPSSTSRSAQSFRE